MKNPENALAKEIAALKEKKNAVILAHNYQRPEIQEIADYVGDSLALSREAVSTDAKVIVFCGVDFMAETAAIMNPGKVILHPDRCAICPMAMMLTPGGIRAAKKKYPDADVVLYINSTAETKAEADCICTSANTPEVVDSMASETILFGPDKNLAYYVQKRSEKKIIPVPEHGVCPTHHQISKEDVLTALGGHPGAELVVHPEVTPEVQDMAQHITSTEGMIGYCRNSPAREFIIGTEEGMLYRLRKEVPEKIFYLISGTTVCPAMKMITLEKLRDSLRDMRHQVTVPKHIASSAKKAIECMLEITP